MDHTDALFVLSIRFHGHGPSIHDREEISLARLIEIKRDVAWHLHVFRVSVSKSRNELGFETFTRSHSRNLIPALVFIDQRLRESYFHLIFPFPCSSKMKKSPDLRFLSSSVSEKCTKQRLATLSNVSLNVCLYSSSFSSTDEREEEGEAQAGSGHGQRTQK